MRTDRIIRRQGLKAKLADLTELVKASRPLIEAQKQLQRAFQSGFIKGMEAAKPASPEPGFEPSADTAQECRPSDVQEETPVH